MQPILTPSIISTAMAFLLAYLLIPQVIRLSIRWGWVDEPGGRKVHQEPIPATGGIAIVLATAMALLLNNAVFSLMANFPVLISGSLLLFATGVWDDQKNLKASFKLIIQLLCAAAAAANGIRLSSFYGLLGIYEIEPIWQYLISIIIITGVTNAFNLMDGIDGLAGGLAFINLTILSVLSFMLKQYPLFALLITMSGAILAFLRFNLHPAKIFMGDGGSLLLGFLIPCAGILLIETGHVDAPIEIHYTVLLVSAILVVPVFDSLRVYTWRLQRGNSPFKPDRTHLHHLVLQLGMNHKKAAIIIYCFELCILTMGCLLLDWAGVSGAFMVMALIFIAITRLLHLNHGVQKWSKVLKKMENE